MHRRIVKVCVEVREGAALSRVTVQAESISRAVSTMKGRHPGRGVRVVFPIDPGEFFAGDSKLIANEPLSTASRGAREDA